MGNSIPKAIPSAAAGLFSLSKVPPALWLHHAAPRNSSPLVSVDVGSNRVPQASVSQMHPIQDVDRREYRGIGDVNVRCRLKHRESFGVVLASASKIRVLQSRMTLRAEDG